MSTQKRQYLDPLAPVCKKKCIEKTSEMYGAYGVACTVYSSLEF